MEIRVERIALRPTYTIGRLYINGKYTCDTLEDKVRDLKREPKVQGKTAIPDGKYLVRLTYSNRFKKVLPLLVDVPYFEGVRIHSGNDEDDTEGCILVGKNKEKGKVLESRVTMTSLMYDLQQAHNRNEKITIEVKTL